MVGPVEPTPDPDGQVNASDYASLAEAVASVSDNGTVIVNEDVVLEQPISIDGKNVALNLMGNTITAQTAFKMNGGTLELMNGTIDAMVDGVYAVASQSASGRVVVGSDVTINAVECAVVAKGPITVDVNGTLVSTGGEYAPLTGNGNATSAGTVFNINEGAVIKSADIGIYFPQKGILNINGGTVTGKTAVYVKGSEFNMTAGTLNGTGEAAEFVHGNNGATATGDALVIESSDYAGGAPVVSITGGKFVSTNGKAVATYAQEGFELANGFIKGGTFNTDPTELIADGYKVTKSGKQFKVVSA